MKTQYVIRKGDEKQAENAIHILGNLTHYVKKFDKEYGGYNKERKKYWLQQAEEFLKSVEFKLPQ